MIRVGEKAPHFTLRDTEKKEVSLSDYEGKNVLLLFFPLAFTSTCTEELCHIRDEKRNYDSIEAEIIAISVDSLFTLAKYKEIEGYNFSLLSDWNKEVSRSYGTLYENFVLEMKGVSKRSAFVIDKDGMVRYSEILENAGDLPDFVKINDTLTKIKLELN